MHSYNASDDKSESVVIGHDFGFKDSSSLSLNIKMEGSGESKPDKFTIVPIPI